VFKCVRWSSSALSASIAILGCMGSISTLLLSQYNTKQHELEKKWYEATLPTGIIFQIAVRYGSLKYK
jgi:hypothetical protein